MTISKSRWIEVWRSHLVESLAAAREGQAAATAGTRVDGDHRPENRGERGAVTTQGYLAQGLGQRVQELEEALRHLQDMGSGSRTQVVMGAVVSVESESGELRCAFFPGGDGTELKVEGEALRVLSFRAPLGRALKLGRVDDAVEVHRAGSYETYEILSVE